MIDLNNFSNSKLALFFHWGLGDHIIVSGIVNFLLENNNNVLLLVSENTIHNLAFLYQNKRVQLETIDVTDIDREIKKVEKKFNLKVIKIGFEEVGYVPFNLAFYKLTNIPYSFSINKFSIPDTKDFDLNLYDYLRNLYNVENEYVLIHKESSQGNQDIYIDSDLPKVFVTKDSDPFNNIFYYKKLIKNANEIHCVDSSFLHLVERTKTNANLVFHDIFKASIKLTKNWKYKYYYDRN